MTDTYLLPEEESEELKALRAHLRAETRGKDDPELQCTMSDCEDCGEISRTGVCEPCLRDRIYLQMRTDAFDAGKLDMTGEICRACGKIEKDNPQSHPVEYLRANEWRQPYVCQECTTKIVRFIDGCTYPRPPKGMQRVSLAANDPRLLEKLIDWLHDQPPLSKESRVVFTIHNEPDTLDEAMRTINRVAAACEPGKVVEVSNDQLE